MENENATTLLAVKRLNDFTKGEIYYHDYVDQRAYFKCTKDQKNYIDSPAANVRFYVDLKPCDKDGNKMKTLQWAVNNDVFKKYKFFKKE
jgi:hypothetical protein